MYAEPFCVTVKLHPMLPGRATLTQPCRKTAWTRDLVEIQTVYGRLVYLSGLVNPDTGRYE
ncbi:MAG: hypothetical protein ACRD45_20635, partial [Bryobacteraceae bacterium]